MSGEAQIKKLRKGGYSPEEVETWKVSTAQKLADGGFTNDDIDKYFGQTQPTYQDFDNVAREGFKLSTTGAEVPEGEDVNMFTAFRRGFDSSITGMVLQGQAGQGIGQDEEIWDQVVNGIGEMLGDLPVSIPAFVAGAIPGTAVGGAIGAAGGPAAPVTVPLGAAIGGVVTGGAVSGFVTGDTRTALMKFYRENPDNKLGPLEFATRLGAAMLSEEALTQAKFEGTIGGVLGIAGPVGKGLAKPIKQIVGKNPIAAKVVEQTLVTSTEIGATVATISAMTGEMPTSETFGDVAGLILAFKAGGKAFSKTKAFANAGAKARSDSIRTGLDRTVHKEDISIVEKNLQDIYAATGEHPDAVMKRATVDAQLRQSLVTNHDKVSSSSDISARDVPDPTADTAPGAEPVTVRDDITIHEADIGKETFDLVGEVDSPHSKITEVVRPDVEGDFTVEAVTKENADFDAKIEAGDSNALIREEFGLRPAKVIETRAEAFDRLQQALAGEGGDGGKKPPGKDVGKAKDIEPGGEKVLRDLAADKKAIGDMVREQKRRVYSVNDFRFDFVNDLQFMVSEPRDAFRLETGKKLSIEENPGELARIAAGSHAQADFEVRKAVVDIDGNQISDGLEVIINRVPKDQRTDFRDYLIAKRMVEKADQGFKLGEKVPAARNVAKAGDKNQAFVKAANELAHWQDSGVRVLVESGLMSKARAEQMIKLNKDYVPFFRLMYEKETPQGVSSRGIPVSNPVKKFKGSDLPILDPIEVMVKNRYSLLQMAENNKARARLVKFNAKLSDENQFISKVGEVKKPKVKDGITDLEFEDIPSKQLRPADEVLKGDYAVWLNDNGMKPDDAPEFASMYQRSKGLGKDEFIVYEDGNAVIYKAKNPDLIRSLKSMTQGEQNILIKFLSVPSAMMRSGTVLAPDFILRATVRDNFSSVFLNTFKVIPIGDAIIGVKSIIKKDKDYVKWIMSGGANSALLEMDRQILASHGMTQIDPSFARKSWNVVATPYRGLAYVSTMMENSMRLGQFKRSIKKGVDPDIAALRSRDVSLDFHRMGTRIRQYNRISAFLGASINGVDRTLASFKNNPKSTFIKATAMLTVPSLILYALNRDEDWYQDIPEWEKASFWHFPVGDPKDLEDFKIVRIPMPLIYGQAFGYAPVATLDAYLNDNPDQAGEILGEVLKGVAVNPWPTALSPLVETSTNTNFFTGRPLVSRSQEAMLPQYRYTPYTTEVAKQTSKFLGQWAGAVPERFRTPIALEHMLGAWSGSIGKQALAGVDATLRKVGVVPDNVKPTQQMEDIPFFRSFFSRYPSASKQLDKFYKNVTAADQVQNSINALREQGKFDEMENLINENYDLLIRTDKFKKAISRQQNLIRGVHYDDSMAPDEKRQLIDDTLVLMNDLAKLYNEVFKELREEE